LHNPAHFPQMLMVISFLLGLYCVKYIRSFDLYEKEPFFTMLAVTFWGGIWSIGLATIFYRIVHELGVRNLHNTFGALGVIGPVEEFAKFLALVSCYWFTKKQINEPVDGIIYMACVALGFSLIENYFYVLKADDPLQVFVMRMAISTPMHISFSAFMGLAFYLLVQDKRAFPLALLAFTYASLAHGLFDLILFNGWIFLVLLIIIKIAHSWTLHLLTYTTACSPFKKSLEAFVASYVKPKIEPGIECLKCGNTEPKLTYRFGKERIQKCDECGNFVTTKSGLFKIFHFFAALFGGFPAQHYWTPFITGQKYSTLYEGNWLSEEREIAYFDLHTLSDSIERMNNENIAKMEQRWWFPGWAASRVNGSSLNLRY
jgi:RsiW-degrading membrane proteinase PrsW (M82 family)